MKYRNACLLLLALLCAFFFLGCSAAKTEPEADTDPVVARYRDTEIRQSLVDYEKKNQSALSGGKEVRDRDAVDQLLVNLIMLDEAERLGLSVTQEEVDAEFAAQKKNYEEFPEVRAYIDKYGWLLRRNSGSAAACDSAAKAPERTRAGILRRAQAGIYEGQSAGGYAALCRKLSGGSS